MKRCPKCRRNLDPECFRDLHDRSGRQRKQSYCRNCEKDWRRGRKRTAA